MLPFCIAVSGRVDKTPKACIHHFLVDSHTRLIHPTNSPSPRGLLLGLERNRLAVLLAIVSSLRN